MKVTKKLYKANCIEYGEKFFSIFQTNETDKKKLLGIGQDLAADWGGECISVSPVRQKVKKCVHLTNLKTKEIQELSEKQWSNWLKKVPQGASLYSITKFEMREKLPTDVWDFDLTVDENLKKAK